MPSIYEELRTLRDAYEAALETHVSPDGAKVLPVVVRDLTTILERHSVSWEGATYTERVARDTLVENDLCPEHPHGEPKSLRPRWCETCTKYHVET